MNGADHESVTEIHDKVQHAGPPWFAVSPLMHAAGMWTAFAALLNGQTVILYDKPTLDAAAVLTTAEREKGRRTRPDRREGLPTRPRWAQTRRRRSW